MLIYAIDDEQNALEYLTDKLHEVCPDAEVRPFQSPRKALEAAKETPFDVAFLDIQMPGITGVELARQFKKLNPKCNFVFVTGYSEYAMEAFKLDAGGYLLKPATAAQIRHALDNLRYPLAATAEKRVTAQCFGNFEIFCDNKPITFKYTKTKEVVAYLVDRRGALCSHREVIAALWEDDDHGAYYRSLRKDLKDTFSALGCEDAVSLQWTGAAIVPAKIKCDYYDFLEGQPTAINAFMGEYMLQYSWAEETGGSLLDL